MNRCLLCNTAFKMKLNYRQLLFSFKKEEIPLCQNCFQKFSQLKGPQCSVCSKLVDEVSKDTVCNDCKRWKKIYHGDVLYNKSLYKYNDAFHDLMVSYKRYGDYILAKALAYLITDLPAADLYVPVPSSKKHYEKRKFDTIESIYSNKVELSFILEKSSIEKAQGEKNRQERLNTKQTFSLKDKITNKEKLNIILLDDIYTTGRTLYHARDAVRIGFPYANIQSFTISR